MKNINEIFNILIEKESLKTHLQKCYEQLIPNPDLHYKVTNTKKINIITINRNEFHIYIALETLSLFQYRVSLWYEFQGHLSNCYGKHYYSSKYKAIEYIHEIEQEFNTKKIEEILSKHIQILDRDCKQLNDDIDHYCQRKK